MFASTHQFRNWIVDRQLLQGRDTRQIHVLIPDGRKDHRVFIMIVMFRLQSTPAHSVSIAYDFSATAANDEMLWPSRPPCRVRDHASIICSGGNSSFSVFNISEAQFFPIVDAHALQVCAAHIREEIPQDSRPCWLSAIPTSTTGTFPPGTVPVSDHG
jgi:hypothetical protein